MVQLIQDGQSFQGEGLAPHGIGHCHVEHLPVQTHRYGLTGYRRSHRRFPPVEDLAKGRLTTPDGLLLKLINQASQGVKGHDQGGREFSIALWLEL